MVPLARIGLENQSENVGNTVKIVADMFKTVFSKKKTSFTSN